MSKLTMNKKIKSKWGLKYYKALKNAVFLTQMQPYKPTVPYSSLKEYVSEYENLYMCQQCKDCFCFRSSLREHVARKSWILGYWCHHCFVTVCNHIPMEGLLCSTCTQLQNEKQSYLQSRGLHHSNRFGAIRIFYNQCQFFAHLKDHDINFINIGDLMLMPLPTTIIDWNSEVELTCEALMEHAFLTDVHIMDWLRNRNIDNNWWQLADANNPVTPILKGYKERLHLKPLTMSLDMQMSILSSDYILPNNGKNLFDIDTVDSVENVDKRTKPSSTITTASISDEGQTSNNESDGNNRESSYTGVIRFVPAENKKLPEMRKTDQTGTNVVVPAQNAQGTSKYTNLPVSISLDAIKIENITNQKKTNSPLKPSPSSNSSSCDIQSKQNFLSAKDSQKVDVLYSNIEAKHGDVDSNVRRSTYKYESLAFHKEKDKNVYLDISFSNIEPIYPIIDTPIKIRKSREEMMNEFFYLPYFELEKRYDHFEEIRKEISRVMNFINDAEVKKSLKAVHTVQTVLKYYMNKCTQKPVDTEEKDPLLNEWESEYQKTDEKPVCKGCNKIKKPEYYIPAFSKSAENEDTYCSCYGHVCHKCHMYQGNFTRFVAHKKFHDREKPYVCPDCCRKFATYRSLEVHIWTICFHTLKKRILGCRICEIDGFPDMESIAKHFAIVHCHNKIACDICHMVLPSYSEYRKHHEHRHSNADNHQPLRLVLCKLGGCVVRCEDYMLHMEKHTVVQRLIWFKCPFCTFIHVDGKRVMLHLQREHQTCLEELINSEVLKSIFREETAVNLLKNNLEQNILTNINTDGTEKTNYNIINYETPGCSNVNSKSYAELNLIIPKIIEVKSMADLTSDMTTSEETKQNEAHQGLEIKTEPEHFADHIWDTESEETKQNEAHQSLEIKTEPEHFADHIWDTESEETKQNEAHQGLEIKTEPEHFADHIWDTETTNPISDLAKVEYFQQDYFLKEENEQSTSCEKATIQLDETEQTSDVADNTQTENQLKVISPESLLKPGLVVKIFQHPDDEQAKKRYTKRSKTSSTKGQRTKKQERKGQKMAVASGDRKVNRCIPRFALINPTNSIEILNFRCPFCKELINTSKSVIINHFRTKHLEDCKLSAVTINLLQISQEFINGGYKKLLDNKKRKSESSTSSSKRRRQLNSEIDEQNANYTGSGLSVTQETAEDSEGNFKCKKCDQRYSNMTNLREHIAYNHRIKDRYLVCLECGDNFVVVPSLQMHLKVFHGIEDPITYMAQNTFYAPIDAERKSTRANQCHVCMAVFEDKAAADRHLRVHGMAFLNRQRMEAQNALKSPEKKSEMEEEQSTSSKACPKELV